MLIVSLILSLLIFLYPGVAQSQKPPSEGWRFGVGVASIYNPLYEGDNEYGFSIVPDVRVKYGKHFFSSIGEGTGWKFQPSKKWELGPIARYKFSRSEEKEPSPFQVSGETDDLNGLGDVSGAAEVGGFLIYKPFVFLSSRLELRKGFGGHSGFLADSSVSLGQKWGPVIQKFGLSVRYASRNYMTTYFGVSAEQSGRSGLAEYSPDGGLRSVGLSSLSIYPVKYPWTIVGIANARMLQHEIARSSLVQTRGRPQQYFVGISLSYELK